MRRNPAETILGGIVLLVAALFLAFAYTTFSILPISGYAIQAVFAKVGGLQAGADVRIAGIKIGTITAQTLDPVTFEAMVHMSIDPRVHLPRDTVATIASEGLLGAKYMRLEPGHASELLTAGDTIAKTKDFRSFEETVSELIFLATQGDHASK